MTTIYYDGVNPFQGIAPTPLIGRSTRMVSYGNRWGQVQTFTLKGQITGGCNTDMLARQRTLLSGFRADFKSLQIQDDFAIKLSYDNVKVTDISFDDSTYASELLPFEVQLEVYPEDYFSGAYGVLDPVEEYEFSEGEDGLVSIRHKTAAKGFCTTSANSNALENARAWVAARTGYNSSVAPQFISTFGAPCLKTVAERYDRLNATYEVTESYVADIYNNGEGILRYTSELSSGIEDGITTVTVQGDIRGCLYQSLDSLRSRYQGFNAFNEAVQHYSTVLGSTDLNGIPLSKSVGEDQTHKIITFAYEFNNDLRPRINIVYDIGFDYNFEEDIISVSVTATVSAKGPYDTDIWNEVRSVADRINLYSIANPAYKEYVKLIPEASHLNSVALNPIPKSTSRTENELETTIAIQATFDNSPIPPQGLDKFDYTLDFNPSIQMYAPNPILDGKGEYYIFDLGFARRASMSIQAEAIGNENISMDATEAITKGEVMKLQNLFFQGGKKVLDSQSITTSKPAISETKAFQKRVTISASYSAEQQKFTI